MPPFRSLIQPRRTDGAFRPLKRGSGWAVRGGLAPVEIDQDGGDLVEREPCAVDVLAEPPFGLGRRQRGEVPRVLDPVVDQRLEDRDKLVAPGPESGRAGGPFSGSRRPCRAGGTSPRPASSIEPDNARIRRSRAGRVGPARQRRSRSPGPGLFGQVHGAGEVARVVGGITQEDQELGRQLSRAAGRPVEMIEPRPAVPISKAGGRRRSRRAPLHQPSHRRASPPRSGRARRGSLRDR